jgi:ABC-type iron transport system FetAB permease component
VFIRPELVIEPGLSQLTAALLILFATIGITFAIQARFADRAAIDRPVRLVLAGFSLLALLHPDEQVAVLACLPVGLIIGYWLLRRRVLADLAGGARAAPPPLSLPR